MLKNNKTKEVLELLTDSSLSTVALFLSIAASGYGTSASKMEWNAKRIKEDLDGSIEIAKQKQSLYCLLYKLRKDGLIEQKSDKWFITSLGQKSLLFKKNRLPKDYNKEKGDTLKIVIFDIPEKFRRYRDWLRRRLSDFEFKMLQKSVWAGKVKLPKAFIDDLHTFGIAEYVDIFVVTKRGSLRNIK